MRDGRSTDDRAKRSGIKIKRKCPRTEACVTAQARGDDERELCAGIHTVDVRDERYEVNHCSGTEEMLNQVERRWSRMEWSRVSKAADRSRRQRQQTCYMEMALERWSCRESSAVSVE